MLIYTQENFLQTFHNRVIQSIIDNRKTIIEKEGKNFVLIFDSKADSYIEA